MFAAAAAAYSRVTGSPARDSALRAALEAAERASWRDIDTAPKDGTEFFLWRGIGWCVAHWHCDQLLSWTAGLDNEPHWHSVDGTHWRPLPEPPIMEQDQ